MRRVPHVATLFAMGLPWGLAMAADDTGGGAAELRHANGLTLQVPRAAAVEELADGFRIIPEGRALVRSASRIELRLQAGTCRPDPGAQVQDADGARIPYRVRSVESGSGGALHVLTAWRQLGSVCITLQHSLQAEVLAKDAFALGWKLVASASVRNA